MTRLTKEEQKKHLSPALLAALAVAATHIEPVEAITASTVRNLRAKAVPCSPHSKKVIRNRKRNKLAAQSRKRNRK